MNATNAVSDGHDRTLIANVGTGRQTFNTVLDQFRNFCWIELHDSFLLSLIGLNNQRLAPQADNATFICSRRALTEESRTSSPTTTRMPPIRSLCNWTVTLSLRAKRFSSVTVRSASAASSIANAL